MKVWLRGSCLARVTTATADRVGRNEVMKQFGTSIRSLQTHTPHALRTVKGSILIRVCVLTLEFAGTK